MADSPLTSALIAMRDAGVAAVRRYHRLTVEVEADPITSPVLFVANHGFGGVIDLNVFATFAAFAELRLNRPVTALTHQLAWTLGVGPIVEQLGAKPASRESAASAFAAGEHVLVMPGGDVEAGKSFADRNKIIFGGRRGFAQLAIDSGVPIVPIVTAGAGETLFVITDGQKIARALRLHKLIRTKALPISIVLPYGLSVGFAGLLVPYLPLPAKLDTVVLPAMTAGPGESAEEFGDRVEVAMQSCMDRLVEGRRFLLGKP